MAVTQQRPGAPNRKATEAAIREVSSSNTEQNPVVQSLRHQVANAFTVYLNYKHYHWQTHGPLFRDLHKLFDEFAEAVLKTTDPLAERIRMIGQNPPSSPEELTQLATIAPAARGASMREMVEEAQRHAVLLIAELRQAAKAADEEDDPGSVDLFSKIVQIYEKQEWWLRDILEKNDGFFGRGDRER